MASASSGCRPPVPEPRVLTKLLVANRGEIARRIMRTARQRDLATVAVYADPDADAPFVAEADESVRLPGVSAAETYLHIERIVEAARRTGADAVHPGYGFLSESAPFATACTEAGLCFIGPPARVIAAMGSKVNAKALMARAGVPVLPGAEVHGPDDVREAGRTIGWPLLVKASFGGGGRGMRVVGADGEVDEAVAAARREARAAFGDDALLVERYLVAPRHVEVQIFGDQYGRVVHLFERECSIQRRHQKVVEEAPSPALDDALRRDLCEAAVTAARALGYQGAGTVEFVLDEDRRFYFLEVNTRLQVEHPVTEAVTGLDLVALQLAVAAGEPLPDAVVHARLEGHAIEARLYAEDVAAGFLPVRGTLARVAIPAGPGIRVDSGVEDGSVVSTHYDALLAKLVAHGPDRTSAARRLAGSLRRAELHGLTTNRDLLVRVLEDPEFLAGRTDTSFLERHDAAHLGRPRVEGAARRLHAAAAVAALSRRRRHESPVQPGVPAGWRNVGPGWQRGTLRDAEGELVVSYRAEGARTELSVDGGPVASTGPGGPPPPGARAGDLGPVELVADGVGHRVAVARYGSELWVDSAWGGPRSSWWSGCHARSPPPSRGPCGRRCPARWSGCSRRWVRRWPRGPCWWCWRR